jgi:N-acetylglucosaminyldiphosphoundecaprenol N-acetyl-beta-D-mannosaminyltransferase
MNDHSCEAEPTGLMLSASSGAGVTASIASVVVPAHNEAHVIGRLLGQLVASAHPDEVDVVVIANGCTDATAEVAASFGPAVRVLSIPTASKRDALAVGNRTARGFPRIYVDADVELRIEDVRALAEALRRPAALAAAPELVLALASSSWPIRWYYDVWTRLPEVRRGLFGRGVVAVSEAGYARLKNLPPVLADDLAASLAFSPDERVVAAGARALVHPPRTLPDLLRVRARAAIGVAQVERTEGAPTSTARTRPEDLLVILRNRPRMAPRIALFLAVTILARLRASRAVRHGDYSTWLRDESSRRQPEIRTASSLTPEMKISGAATSTKSEGVRLPRVRVGDLWFDALTENGVIQVVRDAWAAGQGGSIIPVNIDVARLASRDAALTQLVTNGSLVLADGMPLVWASRAKGDVLPERIAGSSLVFSLSAVAAAEGRSVFILGGAEGIPEKAAESLIARFAGLRVVGTDSPPFGFDETDEGVQHAVAAVAAAAPDLVFVGLGFPRQELFIERLRQAVPNAWYVACGGGIPMAAGIVRRAAPAMQRLGLEWVHRLALEPRRLARRYLRDDLPFALALLVRSAAYRFTRHR